MPFARLLGKLKVTRLACVMDEGEAIEKKDCTVSGILTNKFYLSIGILGMPHHLRNL